MFGAQFFHFYIEEAAFNKEVRHCIAKYKELGIIHTIPWSVPADIADGVPNHGQLMTMTECLYRMMYRTKYLIHQDVDEFIVPRRADDWKSMIALIDQDAAATKNGTSGDRWIASYSFVNRFFPLDWQPTHSLPDQVHHQLKALGRDVHKFRTLMWTRAEMRTYERIARSKAMARPERTLQAYVHMVLEKHVVPPGTNNQLVEENDALLNHFRHPISGLNWAPGTNFSRLQDFRTKIIQHLNDGLKLCLS
jgi:Glycosyltransferase family 92